MVTVHRQPLFVHQSGAMLHDAAENIPVTKPKLRVRAAAAFVVAGGVFAKASVVVNASHIVIADGVFAESSFVANASLIVIAGGVFAKASVVVDVSLIVITDVIVIVAVTVVVNASHIVIADGVFAESSFVANASLIVIAGGVFAKANVVVDVSLIVITDVIVVVAVTVAADVNAPAKDHEVRQRPKCVGQSRDLLTQKLAVVSCTCQKAGHKYFCRSIHAQGSADTLEHERRELGVRRRIFGKKDHAVRVAGVQRHGQCRVASVIVSDDKNEVVWRGRGSGSAVQMRGRAVCCLTRARGHHRDGKHCRQSPPVPEAKKIT